MILKKPYKFLIKNFRLIHLIITLLMVYVVYKYNFILSFFNTVLNSYNGVITTNPTDSLYNIFIYLAIVLIVVFMLVLIGLLHVKKKPIKLYIVSIGAFIIVTILFAYSYSVVEQMELKIVDPKLIRNVRDFLVVGFGIQIVQVVLFAIRTLGFDIKKFDFQNEIKEFDIAEEDNEEFELEVKIDVNKAHRKFNKGKRYVGYFYKENRFLFFIISSICVVILSMSVYLSLGVYNKKYTQTEYFRTTDFMLAINNAYITNKDYRGNELLDNKTLVVLELDIKSNFLKGSKLSLARTELVVGNDKYYHNNLYRDVLMDIGNVYQDTVISNEFDKYLLVYEIPKELVNEKMEFRYVDKSADITKLNANTISIKINARNLDKTKKTKEYNLGDTIEFKDSVLGNSTFEMLLFDIKESFESYYRFCVKGECYQSIERINPDIINNYDKVLVYLYGDIVWDEEIGSNKKTNLFKFISMFGKFKYVVNGVEKTDKTTLKEVKSTKKENARNAYLEVIDEMLNAEKIDLELNVRDYKYIYHLK